MTLRSPAVSASVPLVPIRLPEAPASMATPTPVRSTLPFKTGAVPLGRAVMPVDVGADVIAGDDVVVRARAGDPDADERVAADDVSLERVGRCRRRRCRSGCRLRRRRSRRRRGWGRSACRSNRCRFHCRPPRYRLFRRRRSRRRRRRFLRCYWSRWPFRGAKTGLTPTQLSLAPPSIKTPC